MSQLIKTTAIVLSSMPIGEYDKRLVLLTKDKGKINAFAKGSRRPNSHLLAGSQTFAVGEFLIYKGKNSNSISQINMIEAFHDLRQDIEVVSYGLYFNEFIDYITDEDMPTYELLKLLYKTLSILGKKVSSFELIKSIFELKLLSLSGFTPEVTKCLTSNCETTSSKYFFSPSEGGLFCLEHGKVIKDKIMISESTRYTMQYILASPIEKLYKFKITEDILKELEMVLKKYIDVHINYSFKTLNFIDKLNKGY
ncbi:DNA replication and repair protein RecO [Natranaerovirga pectinivora]|uniref:DNA repair protein RecO n=1 Tax=Natranaerovirga pectinivora TaxID=682400 RepID=A0A4V2V0F2_9FIRM|nr:DNA repair protein RecO [Natranaerovirga pectinivora]TCT15660.1 DNA replication and repair protein RecO [Natranaerovirga pectinivora]